MKLNEIGRIAVTALERLFKKNDAGKRLHIAIELLDVDDVVKILRRNPGIVASKMGPPGARSSDSSIQHLMLNCARDASVGAQVSLSIVDALVAAGADVNAVFMPSLGASVEHEKLSGCLDIIDISAMIHSAEIAEAVDLSRSDIIQDTGSPRGEGASDRSPRLNILCRCIDMARESRRYERVGQGGVVLAAVAARLVVHGADLSAACGNGLQPLHRAARLGDLAFFDLLVAHGARIGVLDDFGRSALAMAARLEHHELAVRILQILQIPDPQGNSLNASVNVINQGDAAGDRALHHAAHSGDDELCKMLLLHGALIDLQNSAGNCALHVAAMAGHLDVCTRLIDDANDVAEGGSTLTSSLRNHQGKTAFHLAAQFGQGDVCELLVRRGIHVNAVDNDGRTAKGLARDGGHSHIPILIDSCVLGQGNNCCLETSNLNFCN